MALPPLRHLEATPVDHEGERVLCLHDPEGIVEEQVVLSPMAFFVAACLDGKHDVVDIQQEFAQQSGGMLLMSEDILKVVDFLDQYGFLLNERFHAMRQDIADTFARRRIRPAHMAGKSYAADPKELRVYLDGLFEGARSPADNASPLACLIVPHIDFHRGGHVYARGYGHMATHGTPDTVLVFGVAHMGGSTPFMLTRKPFATPFGPLKNHTEITDALAAACRWNPYEDELLHRTEHSIEFQAVMVKYLYGPDVRIVPILCGNMGGETGCTHPDEIDDVAAFLEACRTIVAVPENRITVIAAADLAHVGPRFGDSFDVTAPVIDEIGRRDKEDLGCVEAADPSAFYRSVMQDGNARRVCGLGCIYAALKTVEGVAGRGDVLAYDHAPDPAGGVVSFAGIAFPRTDQTAVKPGRLQPTQE